MLVSNNNTGDDKEENDDNDNNNGRANHPTWLWWAGWGSPLQHGQHPPPSHSHTSASGWKSRSLPPSSHSVEGLSRWMEGSQTLWQGNPTAHAVGWKLSLVSQNQDRWWRRYWVYVHRLGRAGGRTWELEMCSWESMSGCVWTLQIKMILLWSFVFTHCIAVIKQSLSITSLNLLNRHVTYWQLLLK